MATIAVISCADTKLAEMLYLNQEIKRLGCDTLLIDAGTKDLILNDQLDIQAETISKAAGFDWKKHHICKKDQLLDIMCRGLSLLLPELYRQGKIHGAVALGGLQNTLIGCSGLQALPIGVPKLMISTVACGNRKFDFITGTKDVVVMPSISDFTGLNCISRTILSNAAAAITGMVLHAGTLICPPARMPVIGTTLMGATNDGVANAALILQKKGYEVLSFHSTGIGGKTMEEMIQDGLITAVMDLTLHEIVYEYFGYGFGYGANGRLLAACHTGIPMLVCPAGIDFICLDANADFPELKSRKRILHNSTLAHVKLLPKEVLAICEIIISRLNSATGPVKMLFPLQGLRSFSKPGEPLYDPELDQLILHAFQKGLRKDIPILTVDCNLMDFAFSKLAAEETMKMLS